MLLKKRKTSRGIFKRVKNPDDILAIIDLESGQVSGSLFKKEYGDYRLIAKKKNSFSWDGQDLKYLAQRLVKSTAEVADDLAKHLPANASVKTFCFLPSLLSISELESIRQDDDVEFSVTPEYIEQKASEITKQFIDKNIDLSSFYDNDVPYLLESSITKVTINGYEWKGESETKTSSLAISQYLAIASGKFILKIKDKLAPLTSLSGTVQFRSSTFAVFSTIRDLNNDPDNFIILDTRGELVDVVLVNDGTLSIEASLPDGERNLARQVAEAGLGESIVESFMEGVESGRIDAKASNYIDKALTKTKETWTKNLTNLLITIRDKHPLPKKIWLVTMGVTGRRFANQSILEVDWRDFSYNGSVTIKNPSNLLTDEGISTILMLEKLFCVKILNIRQLR